MNKNTRYFILISIAVMSIIGACSTTKKTPEQKAYEANQKHIELLQQARHEFPCDSSTRYITRTDTAFITLAPDTIIKDGVKYITQAKVITNTVEKLVTVVDRAEVKQKQDSIANLIYDNGQVKDNFNNYIKQSDITISSLQSENKGLKKYRNAIYWGAGILSLSGIFFGLRALKIISI